MHDYEPPPDFDPRWLRSYGSGWVYAGSSGTGAEFWGDDLEACTFTGSSSGGYRQRAPRPSRERPRRDDLGGDETGGVGVREPRRPLPPTLSGAVELEL
jgi:hypothetical protein